MASSLRPLGMAVVLVVCLLCACANPPATPAASTRAENCTGVQMQGNGGSKNRCDALPAGCWCQEM